MVGHQTATGAHGRITGLAFQDELLGVFTVLDALQGVAHGVPGLGVDDFGAGHVLAILRIVGDGVVHVGNAAFVDQIHDQLHFVEAFEVGHFGSVARFHQGFETGLDQFHGTAAEHGLFAEQVSFRFFLEGSFDHAALGATVGSSVGQGQIPGLLGGVLVDGDQGRHAATLEEFGAHGVARALGGDHDHVQIFTGHHLVVMHVEAVGEGQSGTLLHVGFHFGVIDFGNGFVRQQHHDQIGALHGLGDFFHFQTGLFGLGPGGTGFAQANGDLDAGILQVLCVGMALGAVADDGDFLPFDQGEVGVLVVINFHSYPLEQINRAGSADGQPPGPPLRGANQTLRMRSPRPMPQTPVRTVSRIRPLSMAAKKESSLPLAPVSSMT